MAISLLSRPIKSSCNWNAAGNPIIYKLRRSDHTYNQVNNNGGFVQVQINGVDVTSYYQVTNEVYVLSSSGGTLEIFGEITASAFSGGNTLVTLDVAYSASTGGIIINSSKRTDYKLVIDFKDGDSGLTLLNGATLSYSPNSYGIITVDASILKNLISAEWSLPGSANVVDDEVFQAFYLSYQEFYDGAVAGSVTNDSSNIIFAVLAANQIGDSNGSNMLDYYLGDDTKKFLTKFYFSNAIIGSTAIHGLVMWRDWPFTLSFIWPDGVIEIIRRVTELDASGYHLNIQDDTLTVNDNAINRMKIPSLDSETKLLQIDLVSNEAELIQDPTFDTGTGWSNSGGTGQAWTVTSGRAQVTSLNFVAGSGSDSSEQFIDSFADTSELIKVTFSGQMRYSSGPTTERKCRLTITYYKNTAPLGSFREIFSIGPAPSHTITKAYTINDSIDEIRFSVEQWQQTGEATTGAWDFWMTDFSVTESDQLVVPVMINVYDACDYSEDYDGIHEKNPIHLFWKNSAGGDSFWNFDKYHEYTFSYASGRKAKRIILFATNLNPVQLSALEELNTVGEVYQTNIIDLENTNTINKTSQRVGQQVYIVSIFGTKTGVIVIPSSQRQLSRDITHTFSVEIELPEIQSV